MELDTVVQQMPLNWLPLPTTLSALSDIVHATTLEEEEWQCYTPWRFFYADYQQLQQDIKCSNIQELFEVEWTKVYDFYLLKKGEIERRLASCSKDEDMSTCISDIHHLYHFAKLNYSGLVGLFMQYDRLHGSNNGSLLRRMLINKPFWDHSTLLFDFASQINFHFCNTPLQQQQQVHTADINLSYQSFFSAVESIQNKQRKPVHPLSTSSSSSTWQSCETALSSPLQQETILPKYSKKVKKYWVHPDHILEVMLVLSSKKMVLQNKTNNPSSTYTAVNEVGHPQGIKSKLAAMSPASIHYTQERTNKNNATQVTTVYLDTPHLDDYTERVVEQPVIHSNDTYATTRVRWFNDTAERENGYATIEEKVYYKKRHESSHLSHQGYKGLGKKPQKQDDENNAKHYQWIQQRIWLKSTHLAPWMQGAWSFSNTLDKPSCQFRSEGLPTQEKENLEMACLQIQNDVHHKLKVPVLKTTHTRYVYMSNQATVSIDTDIVMMRPTDTFDTNLNTESNVRQKTEGYPYYTMPPKDIIRFPYCVLQIEHEQDVDWLMDLENSPLLESVPDFSLFLHGVGTLLCDQVHVFPNWISKLEYLDIRHSDLQGSLLYPQKPLKVSITENEETSYWSSNTIATIVTTCYDEDEFPQNPISSSSSCSSLLSPVTPQGKLRRSFDSYCSFDHPTSSRSDPTNCKSCMGKILMGDSKHGIKKKPHSDHPTFYSIVRDARLWCSRSSTEEKEPLLPTHKSTHTTPKKSNMTKVAAVLLSSTCIISSSLYLLYIA